MMHHSLADGIGGMQMLALVFDVQPEPADLGAVAPRAADATNPLDVVAPPWLDGGRPSRLARPASVGGGPG